MVDEPTRVAVACQGGGTHTAFAAGALRGILRNRPAEYEITALSGTSGGAINAALAWYGLRLDDEALAVELLEGFWEEVAAKTVFDALLNDALQWTNRLVSNVGFLGTSPYYNPAAIAARGQLRRAIASRIDFDRAIAAGSDPDLLAGSVEVRSGEFTVFRNGEGGVDGLLASSAVPILFPAVEVGDDAFWDGLFARNPPVDEFVTDGPAAEKPDEIWIVRINPFRIDEVPVALEEILDRRSELTANLSLRQELRTIETLNDLVASGVIDDERFKRIPVREIELELDLGLATKVDRDPAFLARLMDRGEEKASQFWA
jgi:NTE family protein